MSFKEQLKAKREKDLQDANLAKATEKTRRSKPEDYEAPPELSELSVPAFTRIKIKRLMAQHTAITEAQGKLKKQKDLLTGELKRLCVAHNLERFQEAGLQASYYKTTRQTVMKDLLMSQGIPLVKILKATITKDSYSIRVSAVSEDDNNNEEENYYD